MGNLQEIHRDTATHLSASAGSSHTLPSEVPSFPTIMQAQIAQERKMRNEPAELYPRDGNVRLAMLEESVGDLIGVKKENVIIYNNGMAAIGEALEFTHPVADTVIVHGSGLYSQSNWYITKELRERGVKPFAVDANNTSDVLSALERRRPAILFLETVANAPQMQVADLEAILTHPITRDVDPLIILDNTLPTATGVPTSDMFFDSNQKIVVVESGTKYIGMNRETMGVIYSDNKELIDILRGRRPRKGPILSDSAVQTIEYLIPPTREEYDRRLRTIFQNTLSLARACQEVNPAVFVTHPNLTHDNADYVNRKYPEGITPVFFLEPTNPDTFDHWAIAENLWSHPSIKESSRLGQSFGFDHIRIWPDANYPVVRIAGGTCSPQQQEAINQAFQEALSENF